jgi:hypothetical protein
VTSLGSFALARTACPDRGDGDGGGGGGDDDNDNDNDGEDDTAR